MVHVIAFDGVQFDNLERTDNTLDLSQEAQRRHTPATLRDLFLVQPKPQKDFDA
jgi:hypothetical protein